MSKVTDITDWAPNQDTVQVLERMLEFAKTGELRTVAAVCGFADGAWDSRWSIDQRTSGRSLVGESTMLTQSLAARQLWVDGDSVFNEMVEG